MDISCSHEIFFENAKNIPERLGDRRVHLVVTSPPYGSLKDYGSDEQLGFSDNPTTYRKGLADILEGCIDVLYPSCHLCVNIGNQFMSTTKKLPYRTIPLHEYMISDLMGRRNDIVYIGTIIWKKVTTSKTSGGGQVMGSVYYPRKPRFFQNREYVAIFQKLGRDKQRPTAELKQASYIDIDTWREYVKDEWSFPPERQDVHPAMFPEELPHRLIRMFSFVGDTVLDPFLGSGTTVRAAAKLGRNGIGFEIGFNSVGEWQSIIKEKIDVGTWAFENNGIKVLVKNSYKYLS